tara:strand:- start:73 stop:396 length:324 start_codon:yes stop_codon:yes gene_type:complete
VKIDMITTVKGFITANKDLADNDIDLIYNIWKWQFTKCKPPVNIDKVSAKSLLKHLKRGTISSFSNISRSRRKCQEMYPETRGEAYAKRHREQASVKAQLRAAEQQR